MVAAACAASAELLGEPRRLPGVLDLVVQLLLVLLGMAFVFRPEAIQHGVHLGTAPPLAGLILACALALAAYAGIEAIGEMASDARDPERDLAWASAGLVASVVSVAAAVSLVALMATPVVRSPGGSYSTLLAEPSPHGYAAYPVLGIVSAIPLHVLRTGMEYLVGLLVAIMLAFVAHTALRSASRLARWLGQHHQLPGTRRRVTPEAPDPGRGDRGVREPRRRASRSSRLCRRGRHAGRGVRLRRPDRLHEHPRRRSSCCAGANPAATGPSRRL